MHVVYSLFDQVKTDDLILPSQGLKYIYVCMYVSIQAVEEVPEGWLGWADSDAVSFCFFLCSNLPFQTARLQELLEATDVVHRLRYVRMYVFIYVCCACIQMIPLKV